MNPTSNRCAPGRFSDTRRPALRPAVRSAVLKLLLLALLPLSGTAATAADGFYLDREPDFGSRFGGDFGSDVGNLLDQRQDAAPFFQIEQFRSRFDGDNFLGRNADRGAFGEGFNGSSADVARPATDRSGLAAISDPLLTAGDLLRSAFIDALDPTIGLARPEGAVDAFAPGRDVVEPSFTQADRFGSTFRLIDDQRPASSASAPVLGLRLGERSSLRLQMGGMETREQDGFSGGLRFEYIP